MKVICRSEYHLGSPADFDVYKYKKGKIKKMAEADYEWCKNTHQEIKNEDDIEDAFESDECESVEIFTDSRSIVYEVCEVKEN